MIDPVATELVYVVPRATVIAGDDWLGIRTDGAESILATIAAAGRFEPRPAMESDPSFKQVIPYLVLRDGPDWFLMQRTRAGGDSRLHERWSIGVGGHLNPGDADLAGGLAREWREELVAAFEPDYRFVGLLNDDTTDVGRVHLGVVFVADAQRSAGGGPRDRQAGRGVRARGDRPVGPRPARDVEPDRLRPPRPGRRRRLTPRTTVPCPGSDRLCL